LRNFISSETGIAFFLDSNEGIYKTSDNVAQRRDTRKKKDFREKVTCKAPTSRAKKQLEE